MKVLIIGGSNVFTGQLVEKFNKEGWEVYLLTGYKHHTKRHKYVFEQYDFQYDSDSIKEVIDSASPDLVVFTGAYDENFINSGTRKESMYYMSSLVNILMASQMLRVPKFVYISSHEVFEESYGEEIDEDMEPTPVTTRGMLISQGESLVTRYGDITEMDTLVLRLDHMYWMPHNRKEIGEVHGKLCLSALKDKKVPASAKKIFSSIYIADAVFSIYEIIKKESHRHRIYNISTSEQEDEIEVAKIIRETSARKVLIRDNTIGLTQKNILSSQRFRQEFGIIPRYNYRERVRSIMEYMDSHRNDFLLRDERRENRLKTLFGRFYNLVLKLIPFLENGVVFIFVFLLNNRTADSDYFRRLDVFLLYVVLFAAFYGKRQAVVSAFFSTVGFIFRQSYYRTGVEVLVDYNIYIWMAQLFIVGMGVGHLRDILKIIEEDKDEEISFLSGQLEDIYDINSSNLKVKNILEEHIISYDDSLGMLQNLTNSLEHLNSGETLFKAAEVLAQVMETEDVAVYKVSNSDYGRLLVATTDTAKALGKSVKYSQWDDLNEALKENEVFVNRKMEDTVPAMAYGLRYEDKTEYILMIWGLPLEKMSLHQMNLLKVIGNMVQNAITRSDRYLQALSDKRYIGDTDILNQDAFENVIQTSREACSREYAEYVLLSISSLGPAAELQEKQEDLLYYNQILVNSVRETDTIGIGEDGFLEILLANSNRKEAEIVIQRLANKGIECSLKESM